MAEFASGPPDTAIAEEDDRPLRSDGMEGEAATLALYSNAVGSNLEMDFWDEVGRYWCRSRTKRSYRAITTSGRLRRALIASRTRARPFRTRSHSAVLPCYSRSESVRLNKRKPAIVWRNPRRSRSGLAWPAPLADERPSRAGLFRQFPGFEWATRLPSARSSHVRHDGAARKTPADDQSFGVENHDLVTSLA